jgi:hypothetical protein
MLLHDLDLFYAEITASRAFVYARLPWPDKKQRWEIAGRVRGPFTTRGHTLPSNASFQSLGQGDDLLARAMVVDPCTWSPDAPNLYDVTVELRLNGEVQEAMTRKLGLRDLRPQTHHLFLDAKRFVLRGVHGDSFPTDPATWSEAVAVRVTRTVDEAWLAAASAHGVMTVIRLDETPDVDLQLLRRIATFASAAMVVLPSPVNLPDEVRLAVPNLLLAQHCNGDQPLASWAHAAWIEANSPDEFSRIVRDVALPVVVARPETFSSIGEARDACDRLQADLAPVGQFAGYVV